MNSADTPPESLDMPPSRPEDASSRPSPDSAADGDLAPSVGFRASVGFVESVGLLGSVGVRTSSGFGSGSCPSAPTSAPAEPLSIVHFGPCLFRGGAEQQLIDLARFLNPAVAQIRKCYVTQPDWIDPNVARDLPCPVEQGGREAFAAAVQECDVVLTWGQEFTGWIEPDAPRKAAIVFVAHGDAGWTGQIARVNAPVVDMTVAVSQRVQATACGGIRSRVILNGVDTARLATTRSRAEVRSELNFVDSDFVVGYVGRFSPEKRPEALIAGLAELPTRFKGLFVGWGPLEQELLKKANDAIPLRAAFRFADRYLGDYYQAFDAFALLSEAEGFALVFLEAMFAGKPILATPVGAVPEVIQDRVNGLIVDSDPKSIAGAIRLLAENPAWAAGMGNDAARYAREHGHALRMARQYEALFLELVAARREAGTCA